MSDIDNKPQVLLVDDEMQGLSGFIYALRDWGFAVHTAMTTELAFMIIEAKKLDLIITDVRLKKDAMTGIEMINELRMKNNLTPALIVSGNRITDSDIEHIMPAGKAQKPLDMDEIRKTIIGLTSIQIPE